MNIFITGASKGIGKECAIQLANNGHQIVGCSRSACNWVDNFDSISMLTCDVKDYDAVSRSAKDAADKMGGIDVLINNAGLGYFDPFDSGKIEDWHNMVDTNLKGFLNVIHSTLPYLISRQGLIVNLGSVASHHVFPNSGVYCSTKWAVLAISESIRLELEGKVRVTTISPGAVNTEFIDQTHNKELLKEYKPYFSNSLNAKQVAEQITHAIESPKSVTLSEIIIRPSRM